MPKLNLKTLSVLVLLGFAISSCSQEEPNVDATHDSAIPTPSPYSIPVDSALAYLRSFMVDQENTRTGDDRTIASVIPVQFSRSISRAGQEDMDCDNILYVVNFQDEQGYAILAGDQRIGDKVIAITEEGSLSDAAVCAAMAPSDPDHPIIDEYPLTGPGFFTVPETGEELYMNPNTVSLYIDSEDDTLVGNFGLDDNDAEDEDGNLLLQTRSIGSTPETFALSLCISYAVNEIGTNRPNAFHPVPPPEETIGGGPGGTPPTTRTETTTSSWNVKEIISPILENYKYWSQGSPFNDLYPKRHRYLFFGHSRKARAGCFPLAISKILTHFEYPSSYTFNGYTIDWKELKNDFNSSVGSKSAANLLMSVSLGCDSWYFYAGTFTFPNNATSYMRFLGLSNAQSKDYSFARVVDMIDEGKPLIIYSVPGINVFKSHSWNIDGYKIKERTKVTKSYCGDTLIKTSEETETCNMVHCDFGWGGNCNGYYVSGVFKLNNSEADLDPGAKTDGSTNYNHLLKVITY